jgi:xanthine/CO dehydrogenase XdhC/CoxF family maturation factor
MLSFTNHTFDLDADVVLSPSCDLSGAQQADSPRPGTQLFISGDGTTISFIFEGGCTQFDYETRQLAESDEGQGLIDGVPFMTRDTLRALSGMTL